MAVVRPSAHEAQRRLPQAHQYRIPFTAGGLEMTCTHARKTKTQKTACTAKKSSVSCFGVTGQFYTERWLALFGVFSLNFLNCLERSFVNGFGRGTPVFPRAAVMNDFFGFFQREALCRSDHFD
jgi:hypothetical protein